MSEMDRFNPTITVEAVSSVAAIILAAGYSSRMGAFKPLLPLNGQAVIDRTLACFKQAGVEEICVVVGHRRGEMKVHLAAAGVIVVENPGFDAGMFSSVQAGVRSLSPGCQAFFMLPVDIPLVRHQTIVRLLQKRLETEAPILYPTFLGRRGHPPLISTILRQKIETAGPEFTLRDILTPCQADAINLEVPDRHILFDMDTPDRYREIQARAARYDLPTPEECEILFDLLGPVPDHVRRHCRMVARVAVRMASALNSQGLALDIPLVEAAALLHDVAKGHKSHARLGADWIRTAGYPGVADVAAPHGDLVISVDDPVSEAEVVYLADKFVHEEDIYTLKERFQCSIDRYGHNQDALADIKTRWFRADQSVKRMEDILGDSLFDLVKDLSTDGNHHQTGHDDV